MPRLPITRTRLSEVAARGAEVTSTKVGKILGRTCNEEIGCTFVDPEQPIQSKDVAEFKWFNGNLEVSTQLRVDKALYGGHVAPPRAFITSVVVACVINAMRSSIPKWMKDDGADEIVVEAIAAPKAIPSIPEHETFVVGEECAEYIPCVRVEGNNWLCAPVLSPFHPKYLVEIDVIRQEVTPDRLPKQRRLPSCAAADMKKIQFEQLMAMATWQAEQKRALKQGRAMHNDIAELALLTDPREWPMGRTQFTVVLWMARHGCEWRSNVTPVRLSELIRDTHS